MHHFLVIYFFLFSDLKCKPVKQYDKIGGYLSIIESKWGFLFIVLIPVFLIFIFEVYSLIIEIKYGAEED